MIDSSAISEGCTFLEEGSWPVMASQMRLCVVNKRGGEEAASASESVGVGAEVAVPEKLM